MTKHGFLLMILKWSTYPCTGKSHIHWEPKNLECAIQSNDDCFSIFKWLCTFTGFLKIKLLINITTFTFFAELRKRIKKTTRIVEWQVIGSPPKQCTGLFCIVCQEIQARFSIPVIDHPSYSTDIAACDFYLFLKVKSLQGTRFKSVKAVKRKRNASLRSRRKKIFSIFSNNGRYAWSLVGIEKGYILKVIIKKKCEFKIKCFIASVSLFNRYTSYNFLHIS